MRDAKDERLDMDKFTRCLDDSGVSKVISDSVKKGEARGITGSPTFFVNGKMITGTQPAEVFIKEFERILNGRGPVPVPEPPVPTVPELPIVPTVPEPVCSTGCTHDNRCLSYGQRLVTKGPMYCSIQGNLMLQKADGALCQNNYECSTNTCSSGKCVDLTRELQETRGMIQQLMDWLKGLFGQ